MLAVSLIFTVLLAVAFGSGEFSVLKSPSSLTFKGDEKLNSAFLGDVYAASLGRSVSGNSHWSGLYINDPFNLPESAIAIVVDGVQKLKLNTKTKTYRLHGSENEGSLSALASKLNVADIDLNDGIDKVEQYADVFGTTDISDIPKETTNLKPKLHSEDKLFLQQIAVLNKLSQAVGSLASLPALTIIRLSLSQIRSAHGDKSSALLEAENLLEDALDKLAEALKSQNANILTTIITHSNNQLLRSKRQAEKPIVPNASAINVAVYYSEDYPVIFNIILWFMVVLAFSLLAISYAIATMDPGRDSIIYRMTSTRMKKDN